MISALVLNHLKGLDWAMAERYSAPCPGASQVPLTGPIASRDADEDPAIITAMQAQTSRITPVLPSTLIRVKADARQGRPFAVTHDGIFYCMGLQRPCRLDLAVEP